MQEAYRKFAANLWVRSTHSIILIITEDAMDESKIENVMSELLGEGYRIVRDNGELSPMIEWVDWAGDPDDEDDEERVEVNFSDGTMESYPMGVQLRQIWHEDAE